MSGNSNHRDKFQNNPSRDLGGGGDSMQQANLAEPHTDDLNANTNKPLQNIVEGTHIVKSTQEEEEEEKDIFMEDVQGQQEPRIDALDKECEHAINNKDNEGTEDAAVNGLEDKTAEDETSQEDTQDDDMEVDLKDSRKLDRSQREKLYIKGCILVEKGKSDKALKCFLASLTGLTENNSYHDLPQCLHKVSNIYFEQNDFEKAVHFIQAEKMYYETALIDIVNLQKHLTLQRIKKEQEEEFSECSDVHQLNTKENTDTLSEEKLSPEITKARELENLARLCLKEGKPQLALEYSGKATKIYRTEFGDDHPVTVGSLDLFAIIYADVGKKLYEDAIEKFGVDDDTADTSTEASPLQPSKDQSIDTDGVRQRGKSNKTNVVKQTKQGPTHNRRVHFEEYEPSPLVADQDDWVGTILLMILFVLITILIGLIVSFFYCRDNARSEMCAELKGDLTYWYMRIQYAYRYYTGSGRK